MRGLDSCDGASLTNKLSQNEDPRFVLGIAGLELHYRFACLQSSTIALAHSRVETPVSEPFFVPAEIDFWLTMKSKRDFTYQSTYFDFVYQRHCLFSAPMPFADREVICVDAGEAQQLVLTSETSDRQEPRHKTTLPGYFLDFNKVSGSKFQNPVFSVSTPISEQSIESSVKLRNARMTIPLAGQKNKRVWH